MRTRKIVRIDEEKCDGCGDCVPSCAEGAIRIVGGKARLASDSLCDGLGACLGVCPRGAITIEERPADEFDERAAGLPARVRPAALPKAKHGLCPGSTFQPLAAEVRAAPPAPAAPARGPTGGKRAPDGSGSRLTHWPVQLALLSPRAPVWQDADVLIAADCVPFAMPDFHERLLAGKSLAIACPKLDDVAPYIEKLTEVFSQNAVRSVTVVHMEVPCCFGLVRLVQEALALAGRKDVPLKEVTIGVRGELLR